MTSDRSAAACSGRSSYGFCACGLDDSVQPSRRSPRSCSVSGRLRTGAQCTRDLAQLVKCVPQPERGISRAQPSTGSDSSSRHGTARSPLSAASRPPTTAPAGSSSAAGVVVSHTWLSTGHSARQPASGLPCVAAGPCPVISGRRERPLAAAGIGKAQDSARMRPPLMTIFPHRVRPRVGPPPP